MSFEPTKVIEMNKGKQIGNTLMQDASNIPYNNTNVKDELDTINSNLTALDASKLDSIKIDSAYSSVGNAITYGWGDTIKKSGIYTINTSGITYMAMIQYISNNYGSAFVIGYINNMPIFMYLSNGTWTTYTMDKTVIS